MNSILIIKLGALGDIAQSFGLLKTIRTAHAAAHITVLTRPAYKTLLAACPYVDAVVTTKPSLKKIDTVFDLQNNKHTNRWALFNRLLWRKPWFGTTAFATHRVQPNYKTQQAFYADAEILKHAGITNIEPDTLVWMKAPTLPKLPTAYALFVPGCSPEHPEKRWPAESFLAVAQWALSQNITPVFLGGVAEEPIARYVTTHLPQALSLVGQTGMTDMPDLARNALFAVGNDTGPMHLIGPTGCKTLVLFGSGGKLGSSPVRHGPLGPAVETLQASPIEALPVQRVTEKLAAMGIGG